MLAYTMSETRGTLDLTLAELAERLEAAGKRVAGVVQINTDRPHPEACDMDIKLLGSATGETIRISQSLGPEARGCRLDPDALAQAVAATEQQLAARPDILIINKFGKQEADGSGFRSVIGAAAAEGIPVICGVNDANREAFVGFAGELAEHVQSDVDALYAWSVGALNQ